MKAFAGDINPRYEADRTLWHYATHDQGVDINFRQQGFRYEMSILLVCVSPE